MLLLKHHYFFFSTIGILWVEGWKDGWIHIHVLLLHTNTQRFLTPGRVVQVIRVISMLYRGSYALILLSSFAF